MINIELNPGNTTAVRIIGGEKTPILVVDDPISSVTGLLRHAREQAPFRAAEQSAYPGVRSTLPPAYANAILPWLVRLLSDAYEPDYRSVQLVHQLYSMVTLSPEALAPLQRIPHTDSRRPFYFATVHYLGAGSHGGTGFFRHRPTGFERISEERFPTLIGAAQNHMRTHGLPDARYIDGSTDHFELIAEVEYRQNRLIAYPGNLLHSGLVRPETDLSVDPQQGRLTANPFVQLD